MRQAGRAPQWIASKRETQATACRRDAWRLRQEALAAEDAVGGAGATAAPERGWCLQPGPGLRVAESPPRLLQGCTATPPAMMSGQIPDPSKTVGSLSGLSPLTRLPSLALTAEELKYADIHNIGAMITPLHFLEVNLGKRPQPVKSELEEEEEWRKGRREKNKVVAAPCRNWKKERKECLQLESEWLELMSAELKTQMEELKQEPQQFILMLNGNRPTCIVRINSVKTPDSEGNPLLEPLEKKGSWAGGKRKRRRGSQRALPSCMKNSSMRLSTASISQAFFVKLRSATPGEETQADETQDRALRPK
ncbi:hypothetical protein QTO34_016752 [Cnephaeus nilssonii]|uniref:BZIP domain-containing protein n=1 Tax=Cnephaeus nilssonii TaxID=3371016 RepID=A0AA40LSG2_CNENI|nr:hypothetical protein QTO34_016752 [Eptesicus nilssonii]